MTLTKDFEFSSKEGGAKRDTAPDMLRTLNVESVNQPLSRGDNRVYISLLSASETNSGWVKFQQCKTTGHECPCVKFDGWGDFPSQVRDTHP